MKIDSADSKKVVLDTDALDWQPGPEAGVDIKPLHEFGDEKVFNDAPPGWDPNNAPPLRGRH